MPYFDMVTEEIRRMERDRAKAQRYNSCARGRKATKYALRMAHRLLWVLAQGAEENAKLNAEE